jgi:hypothetical protein
MTAERGSQVSTVLETSRESLRERREQILRSLGVTNDELRERADSYRLVGEEWDAWEEITEINYLLNDH